MSRVRDELNRRDFIRYSAVAGAGVALGGDPSARLARTPARSVATPFIITSHTNETGQEGLRQAWEILSAGGSALDAVERCANVIEVDPEDTSVGYGGLPNADGVVQLDASVMDGRTYSAGSVASLENIKTPSSVARLVMERTDHVMLVGPGALAFARSFGFEEVDLMTQKSRAAFLRWREQHSDDDDWGVPDHLKGRAGGSEMEGEIEHHYGTTNVLAVDTNGDVAGITTTSGLSWKIPGRIGDSPVIGAGLYVMNGVGAAGATGRGEDVIKSCASYYMVMRMKDGRSPQEACEDAIELIVENYRRVGLDYVPGEKFVAVDQTGRVGCATMGGSGRPRLSVRDGDGLRIFEGRALYTP